VACFLYQQGAEKLLKAVLYLKGERPVVGHAATHLAARCAEYESGLEDLLEACRELDVFYIPYGGPLKLDSARWLLSNVQGDCDGRETHSAQQGTEVQGGT
jgi:HEPN domain-containing protein